MLKWEQWGPETLRPNNQMYPGLRYIHSTRAVLPTALCLTPGAWPSDLQMGQLLGLVGGYSPPSVLEEDEHSRGLWVMGPHT